MTAFFSTNDIFNGTNISIQESNQDANHLIVTDHPYMHEIGLGAFTTGTLYQWMNKRDSSNSLVNLKLFNYDWSPPKKDENIELRIQVSMAFLLSASTSAHKFFPWRKSGRSGEYIELNTKGYDTCFVNWEFEDYSYEDLSIDDFTKKTVTTDEHGGPKLIYAEVPDDCVFKIITMNDYLRLASPFIKSDGDIQGTEIPGENYKTNTNLARHQFLVDIKSSKEKCIQFQCMIPFVLNLDFQTCLIRELVNFKVFLYDDSAIKQTARKIALNSNTFVVPKKDAFGRTGDIVDGKLYSPSILPNPSNNIAAPLSLVYNELEGKLESGTLQVVAQLITDIEAASTVELTDNINKSVEDLLSPDNAHEIKTGLAIPIHMQNANPLQWSPSYQKEEGCRQDDDNKKFELTVHNPFPRSWSAGEWVVLNKINGVWIPNSFGEKTAQQESIEFDAMKWEFTYFMTNSNGYFRNNNLDKITTAEIENAFHRRYYNDTSSKNNDDNILDIYWAKYFQVTSFDFMGKDIGGLRDKNALSCTQFAFKPNGEPLENGGKFLEGIQSAPFFGCVFPDGYDLGDKLGYYNSEHPDLSSYFTIIEYTKDKQISYREYYTSQSDSSYIKYINDIKADINLFANNNANVASDGMFINESDSTIKHLPADIALNANSKTAINGGSIKFLGDIQNFYKNANMNATGVIRKSTDYFLSEKDNSEKSVFDLKPINPKRIQFRPLKAEVYATFEHETWASVTGQQPNQRGEYGAYCWKLLNDEKCPISLDAYNRGKANNSLETLNSAIPSIFSNKGLAYQDLITSNDKKEVSNTLPPTASKFPRTWWNYRDWQKTSTKTNYNPPRPAGGVGVITAMCTVKALNVITFKTDNYLGITSWFGATNSIVPTPWYPSWGAYGGDSIDALQTTALWAKIYHAWPRDLTVFDPRFFAVFHFNPDDGVDFEEPAASDGTAIKIGYIYSDSWTDHFGKNGELKPIGSITNKSRRLKLLPYDYTRTSIGFRPVNVYIEGVTVVDPTKPETATLVSNYDIYIVNQGQGYSQNDEFHTVGGDGVTAIFKPTVDSNGKIIGFEHIDANKKPYGYSSKSFLKRTEDFTKALTIPIKIVQIKSNGTGFKGYVVRGFIYENIPFIDEAPTKIADGLLLTPTSKMPSSPTPNVIDPIDATVEQSINLTNTSSDNKYDIFFHYHNDISHTMCHDHAGVGPVAVENHTTLEIFCV